MIRESEILFLAVSFKRTIPQFQVFWNYQVMLVSLFLCCRQIHLYSGSIHTLDFSLVDYVPLFFLITLLLY